MACNRMVLGLYRPAGRKLVLVPEAHAKMQKGNWANGVEFLIMECCVQEFQNVNQIKETTLRYVSSSISE